MGTQIFKTGHLNGAMQRQLLTDKDLTPGTSLNTKGEEHSKCV